MTLHRYNTLPNLMVVGVFLLSSVLVGQAFAAPTLVAPNAAMLQDLERRLNEIEQESAQRNGAIERLQFAVQAVAKRVDDIQKDYDLRLNALEKKMAMMESKAAAAVAPAPAVNTSGTVQVMSVTLPVDASATQVYNKAFAYLTATQYPQAEAWLQAFTVKFPTDKLAENAYYWLGESRLVQNNPGGAAQAFRDGLRSFPKGAKVPDNLLKIGVALEQLKQPALAKASWDKLIKDHPNSPQATRAKDYLLKLKL